MHKDVIAHFKTALVSDFKVLPYDFYAETEKKHGRYDVRKYWIVDAPKSLHRAIEWKGLQTIGMVERESTSGDKTTKGTRCFISSLQVNAKVFAKAVRSHWGVENNLHWCLDVTFIEDDSRIRTGNTPACMSTFRHIYLNLLQKNSSKLSIKKKKLKAVWNDNFLSKVLFGL